MGANSLEDIQFTDVKNFSSNFVIPSNLKDVTIANHTIKNIADGMFRTFTHVRKLDLSNNSIATISKNAFTDLSSIEKLNLEHNNIVSIENGTFDGLKNTTKIHFSQGSCVGKDVQITKSAKELNECYKKHKKSSANTQTILLIILTLLCFLAVSLIIFKLMSASRNSTKSQRYGSKVFLVFNHHQTQSTEL